MLLPIYQQKEAQLSSSWRCVDEKDSDLKETAKFAQIQEREHFSKKIESLKIKNSQQSFQITTLKNRTVDAEIQKKKAEFQEQQSTRRSQGATKYTESLQKKNQGAPEQSSGTPEL